MKKPYYRKRYACWFYMRDDMREVRLDPDEEKSLKLWHKYQAEQKSTGDDATVQGVLASFLSHVEHTVSNARYAALKHYADLFSAEYATTIASSVSPSLVLKWLDKPKPIKDKTAKWSQNSKRHCAALLKRVWKWSHDEGRTPKNSLASLRLPAVQYRDDVIDDATHQLLVKHCLSRPDAKPFALYLIASRCGARPQQIRDVQTKNVSHDGTQWFFKQHKTAAKTSTQLVVYLHPCLQTLTKILCCYRSGNLFLNAQNQPWLKSTVTTRFRRLREHKALKIPPGTVAYLYRHTLATNALVAGNNTAIVAKLLGHTDTRMVSQVYGHLEQKQQAMLEAAAKAFQRPG